MGTPTAVDFTSSACAKKGTVDLAAKKGNSRVNPPDNLFLEFR
jgi:hypothetical protein